MLRFGKRKSRRATRAGLLAGAAVVALGIGGASAGSASAAVSCTGGSILGEGASLQKVAQLNVWIPGFNSLCAGEKVSYNGPGSGNGLRAWDFNGPDGVPFEHAKAFTASDDAPNSTQIGNAKSAAGGVSDVLVMPVTQTAITAFVNPPAGCEIEEITNKQLESVFRGNVKFWGKIDTAFGAGCAGAPITRVVRPVGSGTTFQFKNYMSTINPAALECTGPPSKKWAELEEIGAEEKPNITWPANGVNGCSATQLSPIVRSNETVGLGTGGGDLVKKVNITNGSVGYAALPDVEANKGIAGEFANPEGDTHWLKIQNNGLVKLANAGFAEPLVEANNSANCEGAQYQVPAAGQVGSGTGVAVDWSQVFGANTNIAAVSGETAYPLCTLTYDMAFQKYGSAGFTEAQEITVHDYLTEYTTTETGQAAIANGNKWYAALPKSANAKLNVRGAAQLTASKIGF